MSARTTITDLPQELIDHIIGYAGAVVYGDVVLTQDRIRRASRQILCTLCLVKPFYHAATELLYRDLIEYNIVPLLRTLILNPKLAALVRDVSLCGPNDMPSVVNKDDRELFLRSVMDLGMEKWHLKESIESEDRAKQMLGLNALLMLHVPNVETFTPSRSEWDWTSPTFDDICAHVEPQKVAAPQKIEYWEYPFRQQESQDLILQRPKFPKLEMMNMAFVYPLTSRQLSLLFRIKTLKDLIFRCSEISGQCCENDQDAVLLEKSSSIWYLDIKGRQNGLKSLGMWIKACKALETFCLEVFHSPAEEWVYDEPVPVPVPFDLFCDYLLSAQATLNHLELWRSRCIGTLQPVEHFLHFERLETLIIEPSILYGNVTASYYAKIETLLPPSITDLTFKNLFWGEHFEAFLDPEGPLSGLVGGRCPGLPNLRYLMLDDEDSVFYRRATEGGVKEWKSEGTIFLELAKTYEGSQWILDW